VLGTDEHPQVGFDLTIELGMNHVTSDGRYELLRPFYITHQVSMSMGLMILDWREENPDNDQK